MSDLTLKNSFFQFQPEQQYPIYIKCNPKLYDSHLLNLLKECGFSLLGPADEKIMTETNSNKNTRILYIQEASPKVGGQIGQFVDGDRYGPESITPVQGHKVYRYQGHGLMVFSLTSQEWELGVFPSFGSPQEKLAHKTMIYRFLALALSHLGAAGFWGLPVEEGFLISKQSESISESIFIDIKKSLLIFTGKAEKIRGPINIFRLDPSLKEGKIKMTKEELLSFLMARCLYFDYGGLSIPIRQVILAISRVSQGRICSDKKYARRTDLSY